MRTTWLLMFVAGATAAGLTACEAPPHNTPVYWGGGTKAPPRSPSDQGSSSSAAAPGGQSSSPPDSGAPDPDPDPPVAPTPDARPPAQRDAGAMVDLRPPPTTVPDAAAAEVGGGGGPPTTCTFRVTAMTRTANRGYAPRNVGALWVADSTGKFVKSLNVWGNRRLSHLERWVAATRASGMVNNRVDAVTAATMNTHAMRMGVWNCTDFNKAVVPDGEYQMCFEANEASNSASLVDCVRFTKARMPVKLNPPDTTMFTMRVVDYTP
ncbi:MAG TPA: DUF2271 domain-containing protein [Polyangia bacterium]